LLGKLKRLSNFLERSGLFAFIDCQTKKILLLFRKIWILSFHRSPNKFLGNMKRHCYFLERPVLYVICQNALLLVHKCTFNKLKSQYTPIWSPTYTITTPPVRWRSRSTWSLTQWNYCTVIKQVNILRMNNETLALIWFFLHFDSTWNHHFLKDTVSMLVSSFVEYALLGPAICIPRELWSFCHASFSEKLGTLALLLFFVRHVILSDGH